MIRKCLVAAALVAALAPLAEAKPVRQTARARATVRPGRVKVQATTRQVVPTARAGQARWEFWDARSGRNLPGGIAPRP